MKAKQKLAKNAKASLRSKLPFPGITDIWLVECDKKNGKSVKAIVAKLKPK